MGRDYSDQARWENDFGQQQSPIALTSPTMTGPISIGVVVPWQSDCEVDDATTILLTGAGQTLLANQRWSFVQAHFHVPVEHGFKDAYVLEMHFVHTDALGALAVIAVAVKLGAPNVMFEHILAAFKPRGSQAVAFDLSAFLPQHGQVYQYRGSLTTPPLTEGVTWCVIAQEELTISFDQLQRYQTLFRSNRRSQQPRNGRPILLGTLFRPDLSSKI